MEENVLLKIPSTIIQEAKTNEATIN